MKIQTIGSYRNSFGNNTLNPNETKNKKKVITTFDKEAFALSCCMTAFPAADWAKRNFKDLTIPGKTGRIAGAVAITAGLAAGIVGALKLIGLIDKNTDNANN